MIRFGFQKLVNVWTLFRVWVRLLHGCFQVRAMGEDSVAASSTNSLGWVAVWQEWTSSCQVLRLGIIESNAVLGNLNCTMITARLQLLHVFYARRLISVAVFCCHKLIELLLSYWNVMITDFLLTLSMDVFYNYSFKTR